MIERDTLIVLISKKAWYTKEDKETRESSDSMKSLTEKSDNDKISESDESKMSFVDPAY